MSAALPSLPSPVGPDDAKLRCLRFEAWPPLDREVWRINGVPGEPFDDPRSADRLKPVSLAKYQRGYGRWLIFLASRGALDPEVAPTDRVTPRLVWAYLRELHRRGNMPTTIIGRDRRAAHGAADPRARRRHGLDQAPRGRSVYAMLVKRRRTLLVPDAFVLGQWARDIMAAAEQDLDDPRNQAAFRDGCSSACSPAGPGASAR